jgi:hypothetical protein
MPFFNKYYCVHTIGIFLNNFYIVLINYFLQKHGQHCVNHFHKVRIASF